MNTFSFQNEYLEDQFQNQLLQRLHPLKTKQSLLDVVKLERKEKTFNE